MQLNIFDSPDEQTRGVVGNTQLVNSGIHNESSDYRIHVSYVTQHIYIFPTKSGVDALSKAIKSGAIIKKVSQPGVNGMTTAEGIPVATSRIDGLIELLVPIEIFERHRVYYNDSTSIKGNKAMLLILDMLKRNLIPLPIQFKIADDKDIQVSGTDIIVHSELHIQVKCDFTGGSKKHNKRATGNLFLQIAECNPRKMY